MDIQDLYLYVHVWNSFVDHTNEQHKLPQPELFNPVNQWNLGFIVFLRQRYEITHCLTNHL